MHVFLWSYPMDFVFGQVEYVYRINMFFFVRYYGDAIDANK